LIRFHKLKARAQLLMCIKKVELFFRDLAVDGLVAAATWNQAFGAVDS
jgi:hypothetical protein